MFCLSFGPFILVRLQQVMRLPSLMPIFAGNACLYSSCTFQVSHIFVWSYEVTFSENYNHILKFFRSKKWP